MGIEYTSWKSLIGSTRAGQHHFVAPLSASGSDPATHYGCHTWAQQSYIDLLQGAAQGDLPPIPWDDYGLTAEDVRAVLTALLTRVQVGGAAGTNWSAALAEAGLRPVQMPD